MVGCVPEAAVVSAVVVVVAVIVFFLLGILRASMPYFGSSLVVIWV